jgi:hypothetical protein
MVGLEAMINREMESPLCGSHESASRSASASAVVMSLTRNGEERKERGRGEQLPDFGAKKSR